jgi:hypothetical protein
MILRLMAGSMAGRNEKRAVKHVFIGDQAEEASASGCANVERFGAHVPATASSVTRRGRQAEQAAPAYFVSATTARRSASCNAPPSSARE